MDRPWVVTVGVGSSRATTWLTPVGDGVDLLTLLMHICGGGGVKEGLEKKRKKKFVEKKIVFLRAEVKSLENL